MRLTTSFFSTQVQEEIYEDRYPIVLVNSARVAKEVNALTIERGFASIGELLRDIDDTYEARLAFREPEDILVVV